MCPHNKEERERERGDTAGNLGNHNDRGDKDSASDPNMACARLPEFLDRLDRHAARMGRSCEERNLGPAHPNERSC